VIVEFEPEPENSRELQEQGWGAILENFAGYVMEMGEGHSH